LPIADHEQPPEPVQAVEVVCCWQESTSTQAPFGQVAPAGQGAPSASHLQEGPLAQVASARPAQALVAM
jgi:hypothetical protein